VLFLFASSLLLAATGVHATQVSGSFSGGNGWHIDGNYTCSLNGTTCSGFVSFSQRESGCSNASTYSNTMTISGINLSQSGTFVGTVTLTGPALDFTRNPNGTCTYALNGSITDVIPMTGMWNGTCGTLTLTGTDSDNLPFTLTGAFFAGAAPGTICYLGYGPSAIFAMTVTANVTPVTASASATIQYRPQDAGTTGNVYVFAVAPVTVARNAALEKGAQLPMISKGAKDEQVQCVLAQLNASGQLQAVSAANLQAYVSGVVLSGQQAVTILNGVPTANVAGATFYVGYGPSASAMYNQGIHRSAITVPAGQVCRPSPPQTGWWWNVDEGGRGYSIEHSGHTLFIAAYLYDASGRATWTIAAGNSSLDGSLFQGRLESYAGGQSLSGAYRAPGPVSYLGDVTLTFNDESHGTMIWPGGSVAIERFNIIPNGLSTAPLASQPENGWWWNPQESGRGYFLEWQGNTLFMAAYMYDAQGNPLWYLSSTPSTSLRSYSNTWWQYANGQTMSGAYRPASQINNNVAPVTIQFQGAETGIMTLPGNRTINIQRYRF
jgi:hypothetical protein